MRQCVGMGGWDSELLTRVQQVQVQSRWAMMPPWAENHLSYPQGEAENHLCYPPRLAVLHQHSITHLSASHHSSSTHPSVMHQSHQSSIRSKLIFSARRALSSPIPTDPTSSHTSPQPNWSYFKPSRDLQIIFIFIWTHPWKTSKDNRPCFI